MITSEDFLSLASARQSVRSYSNQPVEPEKLIRCVQAAALAPSACNAQPWRFIVVDEQELKNKLADQTTTTLVPMNHFTKQAPVHVVVVMEEANMTSKLGQVIRDKPFPLIDLGLACSQFCLQATTEGLGTCILGWFNEGKVKKLLNIPKNRRAVLIITVGYPANNQIRPKIRKPFEQIYGHNTY